jgi:hypothetical protein
MNVKYLYLVLRVCSIIVDTILLGCQFFRSCTKNQWLVIYFCWPEGQVPYRISVKICKICDFPLYNYESRPGVAKNEIFHARVWRRRDTPHVYVK